MIDKIDYIMWQEGGNREKMIVINDAFVNNECQNIITLSIMYLCMNKIKTM